MVVKHGAGPKPEFLAVAQTAEKACAPAAGRAAISRSGGVIGCSNKVNIPGRTGQKVPQAFPHEVIAKIAPSGMVPNKDAPPGPVGLVVGSIVG
jgi:hypothetical protein